MPRPKLTPLHLAVAAALTAFPAISLANDAEDPDNAPIALPAPAPATGQTHVTADNMDGEMNVELKAKGNVVVTRDDQKLESDWLDYYQARNQVKAGDRFRLTRGGDVVTGTTLDYNVATYSGTGMKPVFAMGRPPAPGSREPITMRGDGSQVDFLGQNQYRIYQSKMNSCDPGDEAWYLKSSSTDLDYDRGVGVAHNAWMEFYGVPFLYTPWMDFPLNGNRKSGFLTPTFKGGSGGTEFSLPYYWNIAPNMDATITPRINQKHGNTLSGEFRYLMPDFSGQIYTDQLSNDKTTNTTRYLWSAQHYQNFGHGLTFGLDYNQVSDPNYFTDFGSQTQVASNVNMDRTAWLNYAFGWQGGSANTQLRVQKYQYLSTDQAGAPYARMPQLTFAANQTLPSGFSANLQAEAVRFQHPTLQNGDRFVAYPSVTWSFDKSWGFIRPKLGVHYTQYQLDAYQGQQGRDETRVLPIFSTDAGLYFDRDTDILGRDHLLTLEPRLFYVNIPTKDQNNLPNFDTSVNDFNFAQMFTENRFSGSDRINGANEITTALTSRLIDQQNGLERLRIAFGKRFYFSQQEITLAGTPKQVTDTGNDWMLAISGDLDRAWRLDGNYEYNPDLKATQRYNVQLRYNPEPGKVASIRYRYGLYELLDTDNVTTGTYGPMRQVDVGAMWPIAKRWYAVGRYNYSIIEQKPIEQLGGLEYNDGCWSLRVFRQRYVANATTTKNAWMFQVDFKGLGGLGSGGVDNALRLAIPGYTKTNAR